MVFRPTLTYEKTCNTIFFEFLMRGSDELHEGVNETCPYLAFFEGGEALALRNYFHRTVLDLLDHRRR
jgi:hypothetical protein